MSTEVHDSAGADDAEPVSEQDQTAVQGTTMRRVIRWAVSLAVIAAVFIGLLPQIASYHEVWATFSALEGVDLALLLAIGLFNLASYWYVVKASLPGLRLRESAVVKQSATAVANTVPAGGAVAVGVTFTMLTSWGFTVAAIARSVVVTGIWNNLVKLAMPLIAVAILAFEGELTPARVAAALSGILLLIAAIVVLVLMLRSDGFARTVGRLAASIVDPVRRAFGRAAVSGWDEHASRFRADTAALLAERGIPLTVWTLLSHVSLYVVLLASLRTVGVASADLSWVAVLAAFAFVRLISAIPITPGGLGVVEFGYAASLTVGADASTRTEVVAAVLLFRTITYLLPVVLGVFGLIAWRFNDGWRMSREQRARLLPDPR